jgi:hypothetical protein
VKLSVEERLSILSHFISEDAFAALLADFGKYALPRTPSLPRYRPDDARYLRHIAKCNVIAHRLYAQGNYTAAQQIGEHVEQFHRLCPLQDDAHDVLFGNDTRLALVR